MKPAFSWVSKIHASEHDAGTAFVAVDQHRMDDYNAYAFMTTDFGKTWTKISTGLPQDWVYVVRQDPHNPNLLYAGMEHGIFASTDKGKSWNRINNNMPPVSVRDLRVQKRERDLVAARADVNAKLALNDDEVFVILAEQRSHQMRAFELMFEPDAVGGLHCAAGRRARSGFFRHAQSLIRDHTRGYSDFQSSFFASQRSNTSLAALSAWLVFGNPT